jgi:hypothetical protein
VMSEFLREQVVEGETAADFMARVGLVDAHLGSKLPRGQTTWPPVFPVGLLVSGNVLPECFCRASMLLDSRLAEMTVGVFKYRNAPCATGALL